MSKDRTPIDTIEPVDDYLWDGTGEVDPDVAIVEKLLRPYRHGEATSLQWKERPNLLFLLAAVAVALIGAAMYYQSTRPEELREPLRFKIGRASLSKDKVFVATKTQNVIELNGVDNTWYATLMLDVDSRVRVERADTLEAHVALEYGQLEAFVSAHARPRFFQVKTPSARCVDLGCQYTLKVDGKGNSCVEVLTGRVEFQHGDRSVYVPAGAICYADVERGPGTPRFKDCPKALLEWVDKFDKERDDKTRRTWARSMLTVLASQEIDKRHTLPVWHLLQDRDSEIAAMVAEGLGKIVGWPKKIEKPGKRVMTREEQKLWKARLASLWGEGWGSFEERIKQQKLGPRRKGGKRLPGKGGKQPPGKVKQPPGKVK